MTLFNRNNLSESTSLQNRGQETSWRKRCCHVGNSDGFTVISSCFFVFTVAVTASLIIQINFGRPEVTPHGAVATDDQSCSEIGIHTIRDGGSAVDATIASLLCLSVTQPHLVSPGGGGVMLVHDHKQNKTKVYDFMVSFPSNSSLVGIPGFLKGLEKTHNEFGKLPWKELFGPSIKLARNGFMASKQLVKSLHSIDFSFFSKKFKSIFLPKGVTVSEGQTLYRKEYAQLLEDVSVGGANELLSVKYLNEMMKAFIATGSDVLEGDLHDYEVIERDVVKERIFNVSFFTTGPPFGGLQVIAGLKLMKELGVTSQIHPNILYESFAESLLFGTALTRTKFTPGSDYLNETSSLFTMLTTNGISLADLPPPTVGEALASQVSAIDTFDLYVSAVVGLGDNFGSGYMSEHGIILNRFSEPSSENDLTYDGRRLSPYTPLIASDTNNICGERIILSSGSWGAMLQTCSQLVFRNLDMTSAIAEPRISLGKEPKTLLLNDFYPEVKKLGSNVREYLRTRSFKLKGLFTPVAVNGVSKYKDLLVSHSDTRGGGIAARLEKELETKDLTVGLQSNSSSS